jgi:hypothetical protein
MLLDPARHPFCHYLRRGLSSTAMTTPGGAAGSIRVGLGRSNVVLVIGMILFLGTISFVSIRGSLRDPSAPLGFYIGGLFGLVLLFLLVKIGPLVRPRAYEFGPDGLRFWHGSDNVFIPWGDIIAIGVGYEAKPQEKPALKIPGSIEEVVTDRVKDFLNDKAQEALQISGKRRIGIEVYPVTAELFGKYPRLRPYVTRLRPVEPSLPSDVWRLPLPPVMSIAQEAGRGAQTYAPARWLGWYARPWNEPT